MYSGGLYDTHDRESVSMPTKQLNMPMFDKAFICFALHGFEDEDKEKVIANARRALKSGGILWILDYNEFDLNCQWFPFRWAFRRFECELASEFLSLDLKEILARHGFTSFATHLFLRGYVRLLGTEKSEVASER